MTQPPFDGEESPTREALPDAGWRRLHPLSPILRGGIAVIVIAGIIIANLRDRLIELFVADPFVDESGDVIDLFEYLAAEGLVVLALLGVLAVIALIIFFSWLSWRFRTFRISGEAVEERSGIVFRQHRRAPLERIQSVNLQRPLLARALGLTQVDVQTAGQGGKVSLRYLSHGQAKEVREQILRARAVSRVEAGEVAAPPVPGVPPVSQVPGASPVSQMPGGADAPATTAEPAAPTAAAAHGSGLAAELDRRAEDFVDLDIDAEAMLTGSLVRVPAGRLIGSILLGWEVLVPLLLLIGSIVAGVGWRSYAFGVALPLVLVIGGIAFSQFNRGWGFTLSRGSDAVRIGAGLTATRTDTVPLGRVHAVEVRQPLLWRPFGWWQVRMTTAGLTAANAGQSAAANTVLPVGLEDDIVRVIESLLPGTIAVPAAPADVTADAPADAPADATADTPTEPSTDAPSEADLRDALTGAGSGFVPAGQRAGWVLWFARRRTGLRIAGEGQSTALWLRRGAMTRSLSLIPIVRVQSVLLRRPPVHRLLGLAAIQTHTVLGMVHTEVRGLAFERARDVFSSVAETVVRVQTADQRGHRTPSDGWKPAAIRTTAEPRGPLAAAGRHAAPRHAHSAEDAPSPGTSASGEGRA